MKSQATPKFWKFYIRLPCSVQQQARKAYQMWKKNPRHPGLHFKRVDDKEPIYSVRVSNDYRVLGLLEGDMVLPSFPCSSVGTKKISLDMVF